MRFAVAVLSLLFCSEVLAQTRTETTLLASARRQGTQTSNSIVTRTESLDFEVSMTLDPADVTDPTNSILLTLEGFFNDSQSWQRLTVGLWEGGKLDREGNPRQPFIGYASNAKPDRVRLVVDLSKSQICSARLSEAARSDQRVK